MPPYLSERSRCVCVSTVFDVALWMIPLRIPSLTLRHREPIRFDVKRERKKRYLARRPEKQTRRHEWAQAIQDWCIENYLTTCPPIEKMMRILWEEYAVEDDESAQPDQ